MTDPTDGGTVTYHRADYRPGTDEPWLVWFTKDQADPYWFTAEQGEAMGLTPPEPEPPSPIDTDVAELVELIDRYGAMGVALTLLAHDDITNVDDFLDSLLERWMELRDARQDPQPASDPEPPTPCDECETTGRNCIAHRSDPEPAVEPDADDDHYKAWKSDMAKWKRDRDERDGWKETARQYAQKAEYWRDRLNDHKASLAIQAFTAPDEDEAVMMESLVARIADLQAKVDLHSAPEPASADSDTLDFDAMPVGTVLRCTWNGEAIRIKIDGGVWSHNGVNPSADLIPANWEVVYQPGPVSPAEGLRAVLAGRDDADELMQSFKSWTWPDKRTSTGRAMRAVGDAARSGGATNG